MTPEQVRQALYNTLYQPRNHAPVIREALKKEKPLLAAGASNESSNELESVLWRIITQTT